MERRLKGLVRTNRTTGVDPSVLGMDGKRELKGGMTTEDIRSLYE